MLTFNKMWGVITPEQAQEKIAASYSDRKAWAKKAIINIANAGKFSSDRTIEDYVKDIWKIKKLTCQFEFKLAVDSWLPVDITPQKWGVFFLCPMDKNKPNRHVPHAPTAMSPHSLHLRKKKDRTRQQSCAAKTIKYEEKSCFKTE